MHMSSTLRGFSKTAAGLNAIFVFFFPLINILLFLVRVKVSFDSYLDTLVYQNFAGGH